MSANNSSANTFEQNITVNSARGEIIAQILGQDIPMCLTIGSLAQLEIWSEEDLSAIFNRLENGKATLSDTVNFIKAGISGYSTKHNLKTPPIIKQIESASPLEVLPQLTKAVKELLNISFNQIDDLSSQ